MTPGEALRRLVDLGVSASLENDQVKIAPSKKVSPDLLSELREIRDDLFDALAPITYEVVVEVPEALTRPGPLGFDVETTGLRPTEDSLRLIQLTADGRHVYVFKKLTPELAELLRSAELVAHNATFDVMWLLVNGVEPTNVHCTQLEAFDANLGLPIPLKLSVLADHLLGRAKTSVDHSCWANERLTAEQLEYAAFDAAAVYRIHRLLLPRVSRAYERHRALIVPTARTQLAGLPVNTAELDSRLAEADAVCSAALQKVLSVLLPTGDSRKEPRKVIPKKTFNEYVKLFLKVNPRVNWPPTPKAKEPTMTADWMKKVAHLDPLFAMVYEFQSRVGERTGYSALKKALSPDGRVRGSFNICGTETGRFSSSGPNLQNLQPAVRGVVEAKEGWCFVSVDYGQIEPRIMAALSGDVAMLACARSGDLYTEVAKLTLGRDEITTAERQQYKLVLLALAYGQGAKSLSAQLGITEKEAAEVQSRILAAFPDLTSWIDETKRKATTTRCVETVGGTVRVFPRYKDWVPQYSKSPNGYVAYLSRLGVNTIVQGGAADVFCEAFIRSDRALRGHEAEIVGLLHDELIVHCREPEVVAPLLARQMTAAMRAVFPNAPIENIAEPTMGKKWSELK